VILFLQCCGEREKLIVYLSENFCSPTYLEGKKGFLSKCTHATESSVDDKPIHRGLCMSELLDLDPLIISRLRFKVYIY
jgi:hypothetical protein